MRSVSNTAASFLPSESTVTATAALDFASAMVIWDITIVVVS
jgi:hypothetical protein